MRVCPRCQTHYDDETRFCPRDGASLPAPAASADVRLGQVLAGQFELREVCGRGAMGTVYRAWQRGIEREVAIKMLRTDVLRDPGVVKRFQREARSVARLSHPNIVTVFLTGETDDHVPFMAMEFVPGQPLSVELTRGEKISASRALAITREIGSALAEAHAAGIVHRDLKPANILVVPGRRGGPDTVKVVDFGIAKIVGRGDGGPEPGTSALTRTGTIFGTPHYLSPEQAQGQAVDGRADLYALGVILYQMLTAQLPFDGSGMAVVIQHVNQTPSAPSRWLPDIDPAIEGLVMRLLEKDPARRPQSADELCRIIDGIVARAAAGAGIVAQAHERMASSPAAITVKATALSPAVGAPGVGTVTVGMGLGGRPSSVGAVAGAVAAGGVAAGTVAAGTVAAGAAPQLKPAQTMLGAAPVPVPTVVVGGAPHPLARAAPAPQVEPTIPPLSRELAVPAPAETSFAPAFLAPAPAFAGAGHVAGLGGAPGAPVFGAGGDAAPPALGPRAGLGEGTAESLGFGADAGSSTWTPPVSPWRRVIIGGLLLAIAGGAAAVTWALFKRQRERRGAPPAASVERQVPAGGEGGQALSGGSGGSSAPGVATPASASASEPSPVLAGVDAGVASPDTTGFRVMTLGERGWAVRALVPPRIEPGHDVPVVVEVWDPKGRSSELPELRAVLREPSGAERAVVLARADIPGRFTTTRRFASAGRHRVTMFPAGSGAKLSVWFDLTVGAEGVGPAPSDEKARTPVRPAGGKKRAGRSKKPPVDVDADADPYHALDEGAKKPAAPESGKPGPTGNGPINEGAKVPPLRSPGSLPGSKSPGDPLPPKPPPRDKDSDLE
jgi:serine/threonine-protein kinase